MATVDSNTQAPQYATTQAPVFVVPDLGANIRAAQAAGDVAYAEAEAAGQAAPNLTQAYHRAFSDAMRQSGTPMPCSCAYCQTDTAAERVGGWLMVAVQIR